MKGKPIALVDMDGTLVDYTYSLQAELKKLLAPGEELCTDENVPHIKARIDLIKRQPEWWFNLPHLEAGKWYLKALHWLGYQLHILTRGPKNLPAAWEQKFRWCRKFVPDADITMTFEKGLVYGRVLIDDWIPYIEAWLKHRPRGLVIMPDQEWNRDFAHPQVIRHMYQVNDKEVFDALWRQLGPGFEPPPDMNPEF